MFHLRVFSISIYEICNPIFIYLLEQFSQIWKWHKAALLMIHLTLDMSEILDNIYILVFLVSSVSFLLPGFVRYSLWLLYSESFSRKIIIFKLALLKFF